MSEKYHADKQTRIVTHPNPLQKKFWVILIYFECFGKYRLKFKIRPALSLCFKKKIVLKLKTNLHSINQKTSKEKKLKENK